SARLLLPSYSFHAPSPSLIYPLSLHDALPISHITGGGLLENIPRVLPKNTRAVINSDSWQWPQVFTWLQEQGQVDTQEMYRTFNCGVGMVLVVPKDYLNAALKHLQEAGENAWHLGHIEAHQGAAELVLQ